MKNEIFLFIGQLCQGGGERVCVNLANEFANRGIRVSIVVLSLKDDFYVSQLDKRINIINVESSSYIGLFNNLRRVVRNFSNNTKVLVFNYNISFYLSILKMIYSFDFTSRSLNTLSYEFKNRNTLKDNIIKRFVIFGLKKSKLVIAQSHGMRNDLISLGISANKVKTINNPVNPTYISSGPSLKQKYILFVGRLSEQKGLEYLLKSFSSVDPNYKLLIVGDGEKYDDLVSLSSELAITNRVKFCGVKKDIRNYYQEASLVVLSSLYEGFPNVLVESISMGTPVVSFNCPNGPEEIIVPNVNGYLANYLDTDDLANKINLALNTEFDFVELSNSVSRFRAEFIVEEYINEIF